MLSLFSRVRRKKVRTCEFSPWLLAVSWGRDAPRAVGRTPQPSAELEGLFPPSPRATSSLLIFLDPPPLHSTTEDLVTTDEILDQISIDSSTSSTNILLRAACWGSVSTRSHHLDLWSISSTFDCKQEGAWVLLGGASNVILHALQLKYVWRHSWWRSEATLKICLCEGRGMLIICEDNGLFCCDWQAGVPCSNKSMISSVRCPE